MTAAPARVIALLGAESTGKSDLALSLARRLRVVQPCTSVPDSAIWRRRM